jgi:Cu(I)/Ag(I) efflux system membrane fusion protein
MFVDIEIPEDTADAISVPVSAILNTGLRNILFVQEDSGALKPRVVQIGSAYRNRIAIVSGIVEGERIVTSANFLIDSDSRLRLP